MSITTAAGDFSHKTPGIGNVEDMSSCKYMQAADDAMLATDSAHAHGVCYVSVREGRPGAMLPVSVMRGRGDCVSKP